jgi:UDP-N-acetylglucosamine 2-epimerase
MTNTTKEKIKEAISKYCEGTYHLEFSVYNFDSMLNDIEQIVDSETALRAEYRNHERNNLRGDMEW